MAIKRSMINVGQNAMEGIGWKARDTMSIEVDGRLYKGYTKKGSGRDIYMKVDDREVCFPNNTPWMTVVGIIREYTRKPRTWKEVNVDDC